MKPQWENTRENRLKIYNAALTHIRVLGVTSGMCLVIRNCLMEMFNLNLDDAIRIAYNTDYKITNAFHLTEFHTKIDELIEKRCDYFAFPQGESEPRIEFLEMLIAEMYPVKSK